MGLLSEVATLIYFASLLSRGQLLKQTGIHASKYFQYRGRRFTGLTLKAPNKIAADDTFIFYYLSKKIRLDVSCESSA